MKEQIFKLVLIFLNVTYVLGQCKLQVQDIDKKKSLIVAENSLEPVYPRADDPSNLVILQDQSVRFGCPTSSVIVDNEDYKREMVKIKCVSGQLFKVSLARDERRTKDISFSKLECKNKPSPSIQEVREYCADGKGRTWRIGYLFQKEGFLKTIDLCRNEKDASTYWAHALVVPKNHPSSGRLSSYFRGDPLFPGPYDPATSYTSEEQLKTFQAALSHSNAPQDAKIYLRNFEQKTGQRYLARGHLVAFEDGFYQAEKDSSWFYANVAPMWQSINNGNWKKIEGLVRDYAAKKKVILDVWNGGLEVFTTKDLRDNYIEKSIYLIRKDVGGITHKQEEKKTPVPKLLFKIVLDKQHDEGIVFVTVNNPYWDNTIEDKRSIYNVCLNNHIPCRSGRDTELENVEKGYTYCCTVKNFIDFNFPQLAPKLNGKELDNYNLRPLRM